MGGTVLKNVKSEWHTDDAKRENARGLIYDSADEESTEKFSVSFNLTSIFKGKIEAKQTIEGEAI